MSNHLPRFFFLRNLPHTRPPKHTHTHTHTPIESLVPLHWELRNLIGQKFHPITSFVLFLSFHLIVVSSFFYRLCLSSLLLSHHSFGPLQRYLSTSFHAILLCPFRSCPFLFGLVSSLPFWVCFVQMFLIGPAGLWTMSNRALAGTDPDALHAFPTPAGSVVTVALSGLLALLTIPCNNREGLCLSLSKR